MSKILKIAIALVIAIFSISAISAWAETIYFPLIRNDPTPTLTPSPTATKTPTPEPGVEIIDIEYAPSEPQVDNEYIQIENKGNDDVDMENWRISSDKMGKLYTFPSFTLYEDKTVKVYTGVGVDRSDKLYMGYTDAIWNDNKDCAYLKDSDKVVDKYCYPQ